MTHLNMFILVFRLVLGALMFAGTAQAFEPDRAAFTVKFQGVTSDLRTITTAIMPGDILTLETKALITVPDGQLTQSGEIYKWQAPHRPGLSVLTLALAGDIMRVNVFVLVPFDNGTQATLNGYRIGAYSENPFRGLPEYKPPRGFVEYNTGFADLQISPHFTLSQFLCKQQPGHDPTYLLLQPATLIKLEALLEAANAKGWKAETFHVMSGFRTPDYNRSIGNRTTSSRHLFGGAADIWLDGNGDGRMDDLNGDGRINKDDARTLAKLAEKLAAKGGKGWPPGGLGVYGANAAHGPFVHIDSRGYKARWGH